MGTAKLFPTHGPDFVKIDTATKSWQVSRGAANLGPKILSGSVGALIGGASAYFSVDADRQFCDCKNRTSVELAQAMSRHERSLVDQEIERAEKEAGDRGRSSNSANRGRR